MIKDLENLKGDLANNYKRFQSSMAKWFPKIITALGRLTILPVYVLLKFMT
jgi:4-hydroxybenzoate polyprenyltransferase